MATNFGAKSEKLATPHLHPAPWRSEMDWKIAIPIEEGDYSIYITYEFGECPSSNA